MPNAAKSDLCLITHHDKGRVATLGYFAPVRAFTPVRQERLSPGCALPEACLASRWIAFVRCVGEPDPELLKQLWFCRDPGRVAALSPPKSALGSCWVRRMLTKILALGVDDLPCAAVILPQEALRAASFQACASSMLWQILVHAKTQGYGIVMRECEKAVAEHGLPPHLPKWRELLRLWKGRNAYSAADYDLRAYSSWILPQRLWQKERFRIVTQFVAEQGKGLVLDLGCGSSPILAALPLAAGVDLSGAKARVQKARGCRAVKGDLLRLPFPDATADVVVCSEVIEHLPQDAPWAEEIARVLKKEGAVVLGTPDYGRLRWRLIERLYAALMPHGYADDHVSRYSSRSLNAHMRRHGFRCVAARHVWGAELIAVYTR